MKTPAVTGKNKAVLFAVLTMVSFAAIFFLAPLGGFTIWITLGATLYFLFMTIYSLVPYRQANQRAKSRPDPKQAELQSYIRQHTHILLILFAGSFLLVIFILLIVL